jgi:hypothetical protein
MMMFLSALLVALCLSKATLAAVEVGDVLCVEGFVMDFFCIERETLLGKSDCLIFFVGYSYTSTDSQ